MRFNAELTSAYILWHTRIDGVLNCVTFQDITSLDQAGELWAEIEKLSSPDTAVMRALYSKVTGLPIEDIGTQD